MLRTSTFCAPARATVALVLCCCALSACVKKSDFEALQAKCQTEREELAAKLSAAEQKGVSLEEALAKEQARAKELEAEIERLKGELGESQARVLEQQHQLTDMVKNSANMKA